MERARLWNFASLLLLAASGCSAGADPGGGGGNGGNGNGSGGADIPKTCDRGCPSGYSCDDGVCSGGDQTALAFPIRTFAVAGKLTVNGQAPMPTEECQDSQVRLTFTDAPIPKGYFDPVIGTSIETFVACSTFDGSFAVRLPKGKYRVLATRYGSWTSFPGDAAFLAARDLEIDGDRADLGFGLETVPISGHVAVDGQAPMPTEACQGNQVRVTFASREGANFQTYVPCSATNGAFAANVAPGTYDLLFDRYASWTSFPAAAFAGPQKLAIASGQASIAVGLHTVAISGKLSLDGAPPAPNQECSDHQVRLDFVDDAGSSFETYVDCAETQGRFTARVAPGKYKVLATRYSSGTSFPEGAAFVVDPAFEVAGATSTISWNLQTVPISGRLTLDGQPPVSTEECSDNQIRLTLSDDAGASFDGYVLCSEASGAFSMRVAPGKYKALATRYSSGTSFPEGAAFVVDPKLEVGGAASNLDWALKSKTIMGHLTVDGAPPTATTECQDDQVRISLIDPAGGRFDGYVTCPATDGGFSVRAAAGDYAITASRYGSWTSFPDGTFGLVDRIAIH